MHPTVLSRPDPSSMGCAFTFFAGLQLLQRTIFGRIGTRVRSRRAEVLASCALHHSWVTSSNAVCSAANLYDNTSLDR